MARIRTIKPEFFTSDDVVGLSPLARLLFIATWCEADREGRLEWRPRTLKRRYFPDEDCDIVGLCNELVGADVVRLYGDELAYIPTFPKHQHVNGKEAPSKLPAPPEAVDSNACSTRDSRVTHASGTCAGRVPDAPSFPSLPSPSFPEERGTGRTRPTAPGPLAGTLPRDHLGHGFCSDRFCVSAGMFDQMARGYGDGGADAVTAWLTTFAADMTGSYGGPQWLLKHWDAHLMASGRVTPAPAASAKPRSFRGIAAQLDAEARR